MTGTFKPLPLPAHSTRVEQKGNPVIIDTDVSHDDIAAILYLLQHPGVKVTGISIVHGVAYTEAGYKVVNRLLTLAGRTDIPVVMGASQALKGNNAFPNSWRDMVGLGMHLVLPRSGTGVYYDSIRNFYQKLVMEAKGPVKIIALGPLTNIARVLNEVPALKDKLEAVVVSGGALYVKGTIKKEYPAVDNEVSEWNLWVDSYAAAEIFTSNAKLIGIPADVTGIRGDSPLLVTTGLMKRLGSRLRWRETNLTLSIMKNLPLQFTGKNGWPLFDLAIAALAVNPAIGTDWREMRISIIQGPPEVDGSTSIHASGLPNIMNCLKGDQLKFEQEIVSVFH